MAVLVEGISIVIRKDAIERVVRGGWEAFRFRLASPTMCTDGELVRFGFLDAYSAQGGAKIFENEGLHLSANGAAADFVIVDQLHGPTSRCDWIDFGRAEIDGMRVMACRLKGSTLTTLVAPDAWLAETSASARHVLIDASEVTPDLQKVGERHELTIYADPHNNRRLYVRNGPGAPQ